MRSGGADDELPTISVKEDLKGNAARANQFIVTLIFYLALAGVGDMTKQFNHEFLLALVVIPTLSRRYSNIITIHIHLVALYSL